MAREVLEQGAPQTPPARFRQHPDRQQLQLVDDPPAQRVAERITTRLADGTIESEVRKK